MLVKTIPLLPVNSPSVEDKLTLKALLEVTEVLAQKLNKYKESSLKYESTLAVIVPPLEFKLFKE